MMMRYLKTLGLFWSTSLATEMEYRTNFTLAAFTSLGQMAGAVFLFFLMFRGATNVNGWTFEQSLLVVGFFTILNGVASTLLRQNLSRIVAHVRQGTLDFILLKPIDAQFWLSTRNLSPWGLPDIAYGCIILGYAGYNLGLSPLAFLAALPPLLLGIIGLYGLWFILGTTSIWFVKVANVTYVLQSLLDAGRFPIQTLPSGVYRFIFTFIVPVAFLTTVPAQTMLGRAELGWLAGALGFAAVSLTLSRLWWRFALRFYTSASS